MKRALLIPLFTAFLCGSILFLLSCSSSVDDNKPQDYDYLAVPEGFPPIPFPADNPYSKAKVELGRRLFYEKILSRDTTISCSHCLKQTHSFSDCTPISIGYMGAAEYRNTMILSNVAYRTALFWDGRGSRIEAPAYRSIFLIYIFGSDTNEINRRLENHPEYPALFSEAFGEGTKPTSYLASLAIATFARTLVSGNSRYDKYTRGDLSALDEKEIRGMNLFFSEKTRCSVCHSGIFFTDGKYHNTGTTTHYFDRGRYYVTLNMNDRGKFLTPSLRNVEVTAPYTHDGELFTLENVINNYNVGGKPFINKDTLLRPLNLTPEEITDIIAFLKTLTDWDFINNPHFRYP